MSIFQGHMLHKDLMVGRSPHFETKNTYLKSIKGIGDGSQRYVTCSWSEVHHLIQTNHFSFQKNKTANFGRQKTFFYVNSVVVPYAKSVAVQGHIFSQQYIVGSPDFGTV